MTIIELLEKFNSVSIGSQYDEVIVALGQPLKETPKDDFVILRYHSNVPTYAQYLFFADKHLVMKIAGTSEIEVKFDTYLKQYGNPEQSIRQYPSNIHDDLQRVVNIWPRKGVAIITAGNRIDSRVYQIQYYEETTLEKFFERWGKEYAQNQTVNISGLVSQSSQMKQSVSSPPAQAAITKQLSYQVPIITVLVLIIIFTVLVFFFRKKR